MFFHERKLAISNRFCLLESLATQEEVNFDTRPAFFVPHSQCVKISKKCLTGFEKFDFTTLRAKRARLKKIQSEKRNAHFCTFDKKFPFLHTVQNLHFLSKN